MYIIEMAIKMAAMGPRNFIRFSPALHSFDIFVILSGIVDVFVSILFLKDSESSEAMTILRGIRILRLFKIAKYWRRFEILLETIWMTLLNLAPITYLMVVILFIYTLLGLEFFANKSKFDPFTN